MRRAAALALAVAACGTDAPTASPRASPAARAPLIVIGIDGGTFHVADPLLARGELPNLAAIRGAGVHGVLESFAPALSPLVWTTLVTGVPPERHGIQGFLARLPGRPQSTLVPSTERRVPALWNVASDAGLRVGVVGWWATWPAERVRGFVVSDALIRMGELDDATSPPEIARRVSDIASRGPEPGPFLRTLLGTDPTVPCPRWTPETASYPAEIGESLESSLCAAVRRDLATVEIARTLSRDERPDVLFVYVKAVDTVSHLFWRFSFPDEATWRVPPTPADVARYRGTVPGIYRFTDALVGRLLEGRALDDVVVLSDHGFHADPDCGGVIFAYNDLLADLGYLGGTEANVDWTRTVVVHDAVPWEPAGALFLNLRERSPQGIVSAAEYPDRVREIAARLAGLRTERGHPLFEGVEADPSPPLDRRGADLRLHPAPGLDGSDAIRLGGRRIPVARYLRERGMSGAHAGDGPDSLEGILFARGPQIARRPDRVRASVYDVAPSLACLLHVPPPVAGARDSSRTFLAADALERCGAWGGAAGPVAGPRQAPRDIPDDPRLREQVRALGYAE